MPPLRWLGESLFRIKFVLLTYLYTSCSPWPEQLWLDWQHTANQQKLNPQSWLAGRTLLEWLQNRHKPHSLKQDICKVVVSGIAAASGR